jgi:purine-nucleoside/S-methyl-5'-thioadenosine phosphorylase / adenosine deaminase
MGSPPGHTTRTLAEIPVEGPVPRFEVPGWRERYAVCAGISGRGVGPGRGFDLGLWSQEPIGEVMNRWLAFRRAVAGFPAVVLGNQIHGVEVRQIESGEGWIQIQGIDGWVSTTPGILLTVTVADCIPVYLVVPGRAVALLHAGWRGTAGGILERGVEALLAASRGVGSDLIMHCGVGICGDCYEVGSEVISGCGAVAEGEGPWHLDLREVLIERAGRLGLTQVTRSTWCSAHDPGSFYSHRASGGRDGRMVAYLGLISRLASNPHRE